MIDDELVAFWIAFEMLPFLRLEGLNDEGFFIA